MKSVKILRLPLLIALTSSMGITPATANDTTTVNNDATAMANDMTAERPAFVQGSVAPQEFIDEASASGIAEVELAQMALTKSTMDEVRHFAQMMIEDHTAVNRELRKLATAKGLKIADEPTLSKQAKAYILEKREGESFDNAYARNQVKAHEDALKLFRQAANSEEADIRKFADTVIPTLEHHFSMAQTLVDAVAKSNSGTATPKGVYSE